MSEWLGYLRAGVPEPSLSGIQTSLPVEKHWPISSVQDKQHTSSYSSRTVEVVSYFHLMLQARTGFWRHLNRSSPAPLSLSHSLVLIRQFWLLKNFRRWCGGFLQGKGLVLLSDCGSWGLSMPWLQLRLPMWEPVHLQGGNNGHHQLYSGTQFHLQGE